MEIDRLSNLPDHVIYHILSLMSTTYAVRTSVLSKKWRYHWTHIHSLNIDDELFEDRNGFRNFVRDVLLHRKPLILYRLSFVCRERRNKTLVKKLFDYAKSHSLKEFETDLTSFPLSYVECQTLKTLKLVSGSIDHFPNPFSFPSLTTLQFDSVGFSCENHIDDLFSNCLNLENLHINKCDCSNSFTISAPHLVSLTVSGCEFKNLNISTPQLVNLAISGCSFKTLNISTPELVNFTISWSKFEDLNISAPQLVKLIMSDGYNNDRSWKVVIDAPRLKFIDFKEIKYPPVLSLNESPNLDKVNIRMTPGSYIREGGKQQYISDLTSMVKELSLAKSLRVSLKVAGWNLIWHPVISDAETDLVERKKEEIGNETGKILDTGGLGFNWQLC